MNGIPIWLLVSCSVGKVQSRAHSVPTGSGPTYGTRTSPVLLQLSSATLIYKAASYSKFQVSWAFILFQMFCPETEALCNISRHMNFYGDQVSVFRQAPKLEDHTLSSVCDCYQYIRCHPSCLEAVPVVTGTHLTLKLSTTSFENIPSNPFHMLYLGNKDIHYIFKACCSISGLFSTKTSLFHNFISFCSHNTFFINHALQFIYPTR
jgi:hypothetical protein